MEMKYDSLYSGLVSLNKSLGGVQPMPDSEYGVVVDYGIDHSLGFGETNLAKLTPEQIAVATNKGWNLS